MAQLFPDESLGRPKTLSVPDLRDCRTAQSRTFRRFDLIDDRRGRITRFVRDADDFAASRFDDVSADAGVFGPVGARDQDIRLEPCDHRMRGLFVEKHRRIDARKRGEHFGAFPLWSDRPIRAFVGPRGSIGVDADDQRVAKLPRVLQVAKMAGMQQIEHAVREHHSLARRAQPRDEDEGVSFGEHDRDQA